VTRTKLIAAAVIVVVLLAGASTVAVAAVTGGVRSTGTAPNGQCSAPALPGSVVNVDLVDMGGGTMMGGRTMMGGWTGGMMRVLTGRTQVPAGTVSFRVVNTGSLVHELVVLPLTGTQRVGERVVGVDGRVDETGSVGEASKTCGAGAGDGINPGAIGWVTLQLAPGDYELVCNLPGHYAAGMYAFLAVR
jgi:uncharacterized cupredoxin-like copper-binding protein